MEIKFNDIQQAYDFVNFGASGDHSAFLCKKDGKIYYTSELGDSDEIPDDMEDEEFIEIPTKNDLGLGRDLVLDFVAGHLPEELHKINDIFRRKGAYARFKGLLEDRGLLQTWYDYESKAEVEALKRWCEVNEIGIGGEPPCEPDARQT